MVSQHTRAGQSRAVAFVDSENFRCCAENAIGLPQYRADVGALAARVADRLGCRLVQTRLYVGVRHFSAAVDAGDRAYIAYLIRRGVRVSCHPVIKCHGFSRRADGTRRSFRRNIEKGVDVRLALDAARMATEGAYDVGLFFSQDSDFIELGREIVSTGRRVFCCWPLSRATKQHRPLGLPFVPVPLSRSELMACRVVCEGASC